MYSIDDEIEIESNGYKEGVNPMFGEWNQTFNLKPISYSNKDKTKKEEFKKDFQKQLKNKFLFSNEISLTITLYFNEQKKLETLNYADLDNYAKLLIDCMKGCNGLFIDDSQIQHFCISWIDTNLDDYFEITIKGLPDDFLLKPIILYEMPDKLYYPISLYSWTYTGIPKKSEENIRDILKLLYNLIYNKKQFIHDLKQEKKRKSENDIYDLSRYVSPILKGFHKSYLIDSGCKYVEFKKWSKELFKEKGIKLR